MVNTVMYVVLIVMFASAVIADLYDIRKTRQGIVKGVGVEGNSMITSLAGTDKPYLPSVACHQHAYPNPALWRPGSDLRV